MSCTFVSIVVLFEDIASVSYKSIGKNFQTFRQIDIGYFLLFSSVLYKHCPEIQKNY